jgi:hypothetical protein
LRGERIDDGGIWFSWRAALVTIVALLMLVGLYRLLAWVVRRVFHLNSARREHSGKGNAAHAEFYRRLEALLAEERLVRSASQTQREFAGQAHDHLALRKETAAVAGLPRRITDAYYQVRFGGLPLDNQESLAVEQALEELATTLQASNGNSAAAGHQALKP